LRHHYGKTLGCKGCEADVLTLNRAVARVHTLGWKNKYRYAGAMCQIIFGLLFLGFSFYEWRQEGFRPDEALFGSIGVLFSGYGLFIFLRIWRLDFPSVKK
jgi:hypothetical protein